MVDSGAGETVIGINLIAGYPIEDSHNSRSGVYYEDVNGDLWFAAQTQYDAATGADG